MKNTCLVDMLALSRPSTQPLRRVYRATMRPVAVAEIRRQRL